MTQRGPFDEEKQDRGSDTYRGSDTDRGSGREAHQCAAVRERSREE